MEHYYYGQGLVSGRCGGGCGHAGRDVDFDLGDLLVQAGLVLLWKIRAGITTNIV